MFRNLSLRLIIALIVAAGALFSYYTNTQVNPVTGKKQHVAISPQQEIALGLQSASEMASQFGGEISTGDASQLVQRIGQRLVQNSEARNSPYQFQFHLLSDPETINAFALPGGQIFITVGLLKHLRTEDQLAGVLGHEIGHVVERHSAQQMAREQMTNGLVNAAVMATQDPSNPNGVGAIAQYVAQIKTLKYGREDELEADRYGIKYTQASGYNAQAMIEVMEILTQTSQGNRPSEMMSSHPYPEHHIEQIKKILIEQSKIK